MLSNLFRSADLDSQFACMLKQAANEIPTKALSLVKEQAISSCITALSSYRKFCATVTSAGQLILPEALKLLPLYTLALTKGVGLRSDGRIDDRSFWINHVSSLSTPLAIPLIYPRMIAVHDLDTKEDNEETVVPSPIPLTSEDLRDDGVYFLENGDDGLIYVGESVNSDILMKLFNVPSAADIPSQYVLEKYDNQLSKKFNDVVNEIRRQRSSYLRLKLCKRGDPTGELTFEVTLLDDEITFPKTDQFRTLFYLLRNVVLIVYGGGQDSGWALVHGFSGSGSPSNPRQTELTSHSCLLRFMSSKALD
ncbi:hypothetical protein F2Q69_00056539 [Brassica cretica]|uniref:Sec23/Sec24 trunk domain-containing protein n=2 Tax=Brassica TaxID=3705 RepID=A0A8S9MZV0_BRACR|nr:hypothetical protein F2Q69_00056539 [Brassica cretica]